MLRRVLDRLDGYARGDAAHDRQLTVCGRLSPSATCGTRPRLPSITLGEKPRDRPASPWGPFRQAHDLHGARPMGQAAHETPLLERGDEAVDARFGLEVERLLHLVEGGGYASLLQPLMDEHEKLVLLAGEHLVPFERSGSGHRAIPGIAASPEQIVNSLYVLYVFRKPERLLDAACAAQRREITRFGLLLS